MKALTIKQPWASLIVKGAPIYKSVPVPDDPKMSTVALAGLYCKDVENRSWPTNYRGRVCIQASAKMDAISMESWLEFCRERHIAPFAAILLFGTGYAPRGVLLGEVDIVDCVRDSKSPWAAPDMWHWILANPQPYETPIPMSGRLGFWEVGDLPCLK